LNVSRSFVAKVTAPVLAARRERAVVRVTAVGEDLTVHQSHHNVGGLAETLQDAIFIEQLRASGWHAKTSQAFAVILPVRIEWE